METTIPRFLYELYPDMDEDIQDQVYSAMLQIAMSKMQAEGKLDTKYRSIEEIDSEEVRTRLGEEILLAAAAHTASLKDAVESANIKLLYKVFQRKSYLMGKDEYESFLEYLMDRIPDLAENSSELSDLTFLVEHGLPIFERFGLKLEWNKNKGKIRNSIPTMRKLLRDFEASSTQAQEKIEEDEDEINRLTKKLEMGKIKRETPEWEQSYERKQELEDEIRQLESIKVNQINEATVSLEKGIVQVVEAIKNPGVKANGPQGVKAKLHGVVIEAPYSVDALRAEGPNGETYFLIRVPAQWGTMIENALRTMVNFRMQDPKVIFNEMKQAFFKKEDWGLILGLPINEVITYDEAMKILELQKSLQEPVLIPQISNLEIQEESMQE